MRKLITIIVFVFSTTLIYGQAPTAWDFETGTNAPTTTQTGMTAENAAFTVGTPSFPIGFEVGPPQTLGGLAYASGGWTINPTTYNSAEYFELEVNADGANLDFSGLELAIRRDSDGPQKVAVTTSIDGHTSVLHPIDLTTEDFNFVSLNLNMAAFSNLSTLTIRFHGYNSTNGSGTLAFDEIAFNLVTVLPVELAYFDGQIEDNSTVLDWATYSEENNRYFEVMHSTDGIGFELLDRVEGVGNTVEYNDYQFVHNNPENGKNYYRLRQIDFDGQLSYTDIIMVEHEAIRIGDVKVFPNPTVDDINIQLPQNDVSTNVMIYNMNGQIMQSVNDVYDNNLELNVYDWLSGQYIVIIQQGNQRITTQFVKF